MGKLGLINDIEPTGKLGLINDLGSKRTGATGTWEDKTNPWEPPVNLNKLLPHNKFVDD